LQRLTNTVKDSAWGAISGIPELLGQEPDGTPAAELWVGAHPGAPSRVGDRGLDELIAADPERLLGRESRARFGDRLPFLLKVLSAGTALSIQSHPSLQQALDGFAAEEAAGIPLDAPHRSYRDAWHKPELIHALGDFHALCGFRSVPAILATLERFDAALRRDGATEDVRDALAAWRSALTGAEETTALRDAVALVLGSTDRFGALADALAAALADPASGRVGEDDASHAGSSTDPVETLLELRRVLLREGESLALDSGVLHAYLKGLGVEIMAASDNVLRGGLTSKHIDVPELIRAARFDTRAPEVLAVDERSEVRGTTDDFVLTVLTEEQGRALTRPGPLALLCTSGSFMLDTGDETLRLEHGEAVFVGADEPRPSVTGAGDLFIASAALPPVTAAAAPER
jgi:mannose-6-phosphate isomerase